MLKKILSLSLATILVTGCSSSFFDSSVDASGNSIYENNQSKNVKSVTKTKAVAKEVKQEITEKANNSKFEIKPYIPDDNLEVAENAQEKIEILTATNANNLKTEVASAVQEQSPVDNNLPTAFELPKQNAQVEILDETNTQDLGVSQVKCKVNNQSVANLAYSIAKAHAKRLVNEQGPIYVSSSIISDNLTDCVSDFSVVIKQAFKEQGIQVIESSGSDVSQNQGSSSVIPGYIRACRQHNIPLLTISVLKHLGPKVAVNIRQIRVKDGITLVQDTKGL